MKRQVFTIVGALVACLSAFAPACGSEPDAPGNSPDGSVDSDGSSTPDGTANPDATVITDGGLLDGNTYNPGDGAAGTCTPLLLPDGTSPQCANCLDDDGDGLVDWLDPECAGPMDNDEKTFGTGIPGDNMDACKQDCFFDGNSGAGDDKCEWNLKCDPKSTSAQCAYDPAFKNCPKTQSDACRNFCAKLTPNGCDCFGCCSVLGKDGKTYDVMLSSTCSIDSVADPAKCSTCTKNTQCENTCGECELCLGKTTVPESCNPPAPDAGTADSGTPPPPSNTCSIPGAQACNATTPCPGGTYCVTGCCIQIIN